MYGLRHQKTKRVLAQLLIHIDGREGQSPLRAPFGSLELYENIEQKKVNEFLAIVQEDLLHQGVRHIQIKNYPKAYDEMTTNCLQKGLATLNFTCTEEVSSCISVDQVMFENKIAIAQRQKLRKCDKQFVFSRCKSNELKSIYHFIKTCREEKGQALSMTFAQIQKTASAFPKNFLLFKVSSEQEIAAAAIVIKVSDKILYTFYYSHNGKFNKISPVVFLISGIYKYAQHHHFSLVDLGTSMIKGEINKPLLHFKKSIGGQSSSKFVFEKSIL